MESVEGSRQSPATSSVQSDGAVRSIIRSYFVKTEESTRENTKRRPSTKDESGVSALWRNWRSLCHSRLVCFLGFSAFLILAFLNPLLSLATHAAMSDLHSHILLVPFVSGYLVYVQRKKLPHNYVSSPGFAIISFVVGLGALIWGLRLRVGGESLSHNDFLALMALSFLSLLATGGFLFLGKKWMAAAAFPFAFLIFIIPLPDRVAACLETASKLASVEVANLFFNMTATPVLRDGTVFQLPGIVIEVAQECSGIRSSWVLFIASLLAANLFLKSPWRRTALVALVIPLGIARNGFRILVIGLLCVHVGPQMIHSVIHKRGGPAFFALSLLVLFALLWWLRRGESQPKRA